MKFPVYAARFMTALLFLLTLSPLWSAARALANPAFAEHRPQLYQRLFFATMLGTGAAFFLATRFLPALPYTAAAGGLATFFLLAQAHPAWGRRRGLPPGGLVLWQPDALVDETYFQRTAARLGPVFKYRQFRHPAIAVLELPRGLDLLRQHGGQLRYPTPRLHRLIPGGFLRALPPEDHRALRGQLLRIFTPAVVEAQRDWMSARVQAAAAELAAAGPVHPHEVLHGLMFDLALRWFTGLEPSDPAAARWRALYTQLAGPRDAEAYRELDALWRAREAALAAAGASAPPCHLATWLRLRGAGPDDPAVRGHLLALLLVAWRDTGGLLDWIAYHLSGAPEWLDRVAAESPRRNDLVGRPVETLHATSLQDPRSCEPDVTDRLVSECLRLSQSEYIERRVTETFRHGGFLFPRGWGVRICIREAHRDPRVFPDPLRLDGDRFRDGGPPPEHFTPLGAFNHACLGEHTARAAGGALIRALAAYRLERVADGPRVFGPFHHWAPNPAYRLRLVPRPHLPA